MNKFTLLVFGIFCCTQSFAQRTQVDGPYVSYRNDSVMVDYLYLENSLTTAVTDSLPATNKDNVVLHISTDIPNEMFEVKLKKTLAVEPAVSAGSNKMLVLSDIEGNFPAFRALLQSNKVIDDKLKWSFGSGNLVLIGDFVDRGEHVPEVLWLIYSLEDQAKAAGGYVHFILGNHEIMNMSGDARYVNNKYKLTGLLLGKTYEQLYDDHSELGRWLRTKNVIEKIGDDLFVHGGISPLVNKMDLDVEGIANLVRPHYADTSNLFIDKKLDTLYSDYGPFWYRGYYMGDKKADQQQIRTTLKKFDVKRIFTGHSVVAETVTSWFKGRVIDTDVHHAGGKSEALLFENNNYYRVKPNGERIPFTDIFR